MEEPGDVFKVFFLMVATKNSDHICEMDAYRIAKKCHFILPDGSVDELKVLEIFRVLASPDTRRKVPQKDEGRRIRAVDGGWEILNGEKYRQMVQDEMKKARDRRSQAEWRRKHPNGVKPTMSKTLGEVIADQTGVMPNDPPQPEPPPA